MQAENMMAVRQEILDLLRQQMDALNSPLGLTEHELRECYIRQTRVQELRERLQVASSSEREISSTSNAEQARSVTSDTAVDQCSS
jgi:hypothetical protein